jgi:2-polyprenyl-6-methoxyphenol hydroxylase-like FAD-dependent oxidoreductase
MAERYQVVIVGGGPVGVSLAIDLGQRGVNVAVIERHRDVGRIPKGQGLTFRTLEHFYFWNCVEEIRKARLLPPDYKIGGVLIYENAMSDYWYPANTARAKTDRFFYQKNERLPQYLTEEVVRARAAQIPNITFYWEHTVKNVEQDENGVRVSATGEQWPYEDIEIEADYGVGCDGTRSITNIKQAIERHGTDLGFRMCLAVFRSQELNTFLERFGETTTFLILHPKYKGAWQFFGRVGVEAGTFFFHAPVDPTTTPTDTEKILDAMYEAAGFSFNAEFEHLGLWNLKVEVADTYRKGRVFIAGDAAHSHPPYGGHGLNSGLEDVTNLGWKLAATLQGWGSDALLDTYDEERRPIFLETGEDIIVGGIQRDGRWLDTYNPNMDKEAFEAAWAQRLAATEDPWPYVVNYQGSSIVVSPQGGAPGVHDEYVDTARPGHHLAPSLLSSGANIYEELGTDYFTLFAMDTEDNIIDRFIAAAAELQIPLKVVRDTYADDRMKYESPLMLIRPDQFLAWVSDTAEPDTTTIMKQVVAAS